MSEERLDKLGTYFVYHDILNKYQLRFDEFLCLVESERWEEFKEHMESLKMVRFR